MAGRVLDAIGGGTDRRNTDTRTMSVPSVTQLWRYPVKSMQGRTAWRAVGRTTRCGRRSRLRHARRGARRHPRRQTTRRSHALRGPLGRTTHVKVAVITLPSGDEVRTDAADVDGQLSKALDHSVTLWPLQPATDTEHYRRGKPDVPGPDDRPARHVRPRTR